MRRKVRRHEMDNTFRNIMLVAGSVLGIMLIALVITFFAYAQKLNKDTEDLIDYSSFSEYLSSTNSIINETVIASSSLGKNIEEAKKENIIETNVKDGANINNTIENTEEVNQTIKQEEAKQEKPIPDPTFIKPVEGTIIKEFAKDNLVYSETLKEWITHTGVDIAAEKTTVVRASSSGKIKSIKNDPRYGLTIVMQHNNGYTTIYANLLSTEFVTIGEEIEQGESIGTVGNTATFEIADESHLHFEIQKDSISIDPTIHF